MQTFLRERGYKTGFHIISAERFRRSLWKNSIFKELIFTEMKYRLQKYSKGQKMNDILYLAVLREFTLTGKAVKLIQERRK